MNRTCTIEGCTRKHLARGLCHTCYMRLRNRGELEPLHVPTPAERLAIGLERKANGCLEWTRATNVSGYGRIGVNDRLVLTHRLAWELVNGPIPDGLYVCHKCDNPPCCDPAHLFVGTHADNMADRDAKGHVRQPKAKQNDVVSHLLGCPGGGVRVTRGVTKSLLHCTGCDAETWVPR